ncbi:MAG: translation initiation factor eIF 4e-like domain-containing protein, partial [Olpidium bornovanus]
MTVPLPTPGAAPAAASRPFRAGADEDAALPGACLGPAEKPPRCDPPVDDPAAAEGPAAGGGGSPEPVHREPAAGSAAAEERQKEASGAQKDQGVARLAVAVRDAAAVDQRAGGEASRTPPPPHARFGDEGARAPGESGPAARLPDGTAESGGASGTEPPALGSISKPSSAADAAGSSPPAGEREVDTAAAAAAPTGSEPCAEVAPPAASSGAPDQSAAARPWGPPRTEAGPDSAAAPAPAPPPAAAEPALLPLLFASSAPRPASGFDDRPTQLLERRGSVGSLLGNDARTRQQSDFPLPRLNRRPETFDYDGRTYTKEDARHLPLNDVWTLYYDSKPTGRIVQGKDKYESSLQFVYRFDNVADFCGLINNVKRPSRMNQYSTLHVGGSLLRLWVLRHRRRVYRTGESFRLFKNDIKPMWEDPANEGGGKLTIHLPGPGQAAGRSSGMRAPSPSRHDAGETTCDSAWINLCIAAAGDQFDGPVCGLIVQ